MLSLDRMMNIMSVTLTGMFHSILDKYAALVQIPFAAVSKHLDNFIQSILPQWTHVYKLVLGYRQCRKYVRE